MKSFGLTKFQAIILIFVISIVGIHADFLSTLDGYFKGISDGLKRLDTNVEEINQRLTRLENIVGIDGSSADKNGKADRTGPKTAENGLTLRETKRNFIKAMSVEKKILRQSMHNYENKWNSFKSDVIGALGEINDTLEQSFSKKIEQNAEQQAHIIKSNTEELRSVVDRVNNIDDNIAELNIKYDTNSKGLKEMNTTLEKSNKYFTKTMEENAQLQIQKIKSNTEELRTVVDRINNIDIEIATLDNKYDDEAAKVRNLESRINEVNRVSEATEKNIVTIRNDIKEYHGVKHGFSASLTSTTQYQDRGVIVFDNVRQNSGGNYDSSTGKFTVPKTGLYLFSFSIEGTRLNKAHAEIAFRTDDDYFYGTEALSATGVDATASGSWLKTLWKGTEVWLQSIGVCTFYQFRTSFTGVLID